jgi:3'(2'), 5'-bisphosphate nucleotidase
LSSQHKLGEEECESEDVTCSPKTSILASYSIPNELKELEMDKIAIFVDPLDGTKEFTEGNLEAVITLIGIAYDGNY